MGDVRLWLQHLHCQHPVLQASQNLLPQVHQSSVSGLETPQVSLSAGHQCPDPVTSAVKLPSFVVLHSDGCHRKKCVLLYMITQSYEDTLQKPKKKVAGMTLESVHQTFDFYAPLSVVQLKVFPS